MTAAGRDQIAFFREKPGRSAYTGEDVHGQVRVVGVLGLNKPFLFEK